MSRQYDIVVLGATGFTGSLVVEYLRDNAPKSLRWAVAGRNKAKLEDVLKNLNITSLPVIVADTSDDAALAEMAKSTKVVLTTVGPYIKYGFPVARACVAAGTHYCDITGEPVYMRRTIDELNDDAVKNNALIVSACGFDSVPGDLGNMMMLKAAKEAHPTAAVKSVRSFYVMAGGPSGGTLETVRVSIESKDRSLVMNPFCLTPSGKSTLTAPANFPLPSYESAYQRWSSMFIMNATNAAVVNRSNALRGVTSTYLERTGPLTLFNAIVQSVAFVVLGAMFLVPPLRWFAFKYVLPKPGEGPSKATRESGWFKTNFVAELDNGAVLKGLVRNMRGDPGYQETAKMLSEAALCLALDYGKLQHKGGVLPPSIALGETYLKRLEAQGFEFYPSYDRSIHGEGKKQK